MEKNRNNGPDPSEEVSAKELLEKLNKNLAAAKKNEPEKSENDAPDRAFSNSDVSEETHPGRLVYHFKKIPRSEVEAARNEVKENAAKTPLKSTGPAEDTIETPNVEEELDIDELMKKYLPEQDYKKFSKPLSFDNLDISENEKTPEESEKTENGEAGADEDSELPFEYGEAEEETDAVEESEPEEDAVEPDPELYDDYSEEDIGTDGSENDAERTDTDDEGVVLDEDFSETKDDGEQDESSAPADDIDQTDINLMLAFDMQDELKKTVGSEEADKLNAETSTDIYGEAERDSEKKMPFEYTSPAQNKEIFKKFKAKYQNCLIKMFVCAAFMILTFFYENVGLFSAKLPGALNPEAYPVVHIMIDLQLLVLCAALIWEQLRDGAVALLKFKPIPESVCAVLVVLTVIYHVCLCFFDVGTNIRLFNFPLTLCILLAIISEFLNLRQEIFAFNVIASKRPKYSLDMLDSESAPLETESFYEYLPEHPAIFKISKGSFVDGFFAKTRAYSKNKMVLSVIIPLSILIGITIFVAELYKGGSAASAFTVAYAAIMLAMPFSVFVTYSLPFYKASKQAFETESAIIGESALDDYSSASCVSFDDKDVFPAYGVKVKSVKVFGENRIDRIIYNAASVFKVAGGPLRDVLDVATVDIGCSDDVELLTISSDGLEASVDGCHIHLGKANYLRANGFVPVYDVDDEDIETGGDISIMYMVLDGEVSAKMYIQYRIDPDFEGILKKLYRSGICVGIKTLDPNIDDEMLGMRIRLEDYPVHVLKCREVTPEVSSDAHVGSAVVSRNSSKSLLQTFALCDRIQHITKTNIVVNIFAIIISLLISAFLVFFGLSGSMYSIYVALYQLFWTVPMLIISKAFI